MIDSQLINRILCCDCVEGMRQLPAECIPFTLTSPPYDNMRKFGGHPWTFDQFKAIAEGLYRITMPGGVVVWVVADQVIKGSESGTSARQKLYFMDIGFRVHQTLIMGRLGTRCPGGNIRYPNPPEYAFVLSKGKPRTINLIRDRPNKCAGKKATFYVRRADGNLRLDRANITVGPIGLRRSFWEYAAGCGISASDRIAHGHPAIMPEAMAEDLIRSWSRPFDLVFDCMSGAGTTLRMAVLNSRRYLGMEAHQPYVDLARERLRLAQLEQRRRLDEFLSQGFPRHG